MPIIPWVHHIDLRSLRFTAWLSVPNHNNKTLELRDFSKALFTATMKEVWSLPTTNSCTSLDKVSILSAKEFVECWFKKS